MPLWFDWVAGFIFVTVVAGFISDSFVRCPTHYVTFTDASTTDLWRVQSEIFGALPWGVSLGAGLVTAAIAWKMWDQMWIQLGWRSAGRSLLDGPRGLLAAVGLLKTSSAESAVSCDSVDTVPLSIA